MLKIRIGESFCKVGKLQSGHLVVFLQTMQKDQRVQFRKDLELVLKVGIRIINPEMTIYHICLDFLFFFLFVLLSFDPNVIVLGSEVFPTLQTTIMAKSNHSLMHTMEIILKNASFCWLKIFGKGEIDKFFVLNFRGVTIYLKA